LNYKNTNTISNSSYASFTESSSKAQKSPAADWAYHELKTGHDAMITVPKKLEQMLEALHKK
jgi:hypothetical protein